MIQKLLQGLEKLNLSLSAEQIEKLELYIHKVLDFNKTYNLMKAADEDELAVNHILDSLAALPHIKEICGERKSIADIGSGGGCPGIPLAIVLDDKNFTLVERMEKRCVFLENVVCSLQLNNTKVLCTNVDQLTKETFDVEVFRAFHPFDKKILQLLFKPLKMNGHLIAYKARSEKIEEEMLGIKNLIKGFRKIPLTIPFLEDHERNLVVVQK